MNRHSSSARPLPWIWKQGTPPSRRSQAVTSSLSMSLVGSTGRQRAKGRRYRRWPVRAKDSRIDAHRCLPLGLDERQQYLFLVGRFEPLLAAGGLLFSGGLLELEFVPQPAEPPVARVAEPGDPQHRASLFGPTGQG